MKSPDWRNLAYRDGVLVEQVPEADRVALWLPGGSDRGVRHWERIASVPRAEVMVAQGVCAVAATSVIAGHRRRGLLGRLLARFRPAGERVWVLPNGEAVEQQGERQTGLLLVWAENGSPPLDEL